jgi:hypothetical protein
MVAVKLVTLGPVFHRLASEPSVFGGTPMLPTLPVELFAGVAAVAAAGVRFSRVWGANSGEAGVNQK